MLVDLLWCIDNDYMHESCHKFLIINPNPKILNSNPD